MKVEYAPNSFPSLTVLHEFIAIKCIYLEYGMVRLKKIRVYLYIYIISLGNTSEVLIKTLQGFQTLKIFVF